MMHSARPITPELIASFRKGYEEDRTARVLTAAASRTELTEIAYDSAAAAKQPHTFSIELKTTGITNQRKSGRCWLFASMNLMREQVIPPLRARAV